MTPRFILNTLKPVLGLSAQAHLTAVQAGEVNQVFCLQDGTSRYAVKNLQQDDFSGINRSHQYVLQEQLAQRGLAPAPVWMSEQAGLWVEQWCAVPADSQPGPAGCQATVLADVLAYVHRQPAAGHALNLPERLQHYRKKAQLSHSSPLAIKINHAIAHFSLAQVPPEHWVLCHNDLSWGHVLRSEPPLLVDWEYAAMGNRFFDVAACISINGLDSKQQYSLMTRYCDQSKLNYGDASRLLGQQQEVVALTEAVWGKALEASQRNE